MIDCSRKGFVFQFCYCNELSASQFDLLAWTAKNRPVHHVGTLTVVWLVGGGGVIQARISAFQILYEIFVRNLFGVFKDLCRYSLGIAFAT